MSSETIPDLKYEMAVDIANTRAVQFKNWVDTQNKKSYTNGNYMKEIVFDHQPIL